MRTFAAVLLSVACAVPLSAQERPRPEPAVDDEGRNPDKDALEPRPHLQVLEHPYELAGFYRSGAVGPAGSERATGPYALAGFYRSNRTDGALDQGYGGPAFWAMGYGPTGRGRDGRPTFAPRRPLGHNGEWCLFAPTFLAPIGPLTGYWLSAR